MKNSIMALILSLLVYSVVAMAYMHKTFSSKDTISLIFNSLDRIENKLDGYIKEGN